ncbi:MAG TPA: hypothetical protein VJ846_11295 [Sphingomicrobium sp.]|nr:hypothetical protein [Sphingomicrobium sp.]
MTAESGRRVTWGVRMDWLAITRRSAFTNPLGAALVLAAAMVPTNPADAAQDIGQSQISYTCSFDNGPRAGQSLTYTGISGPPIEIGVPCSDGQGSTGSVVPGRAGQPGVPVLPPSAPTRRDMTFICRFDDGPRAGQTQSYAGVTGIQSFPVGAPCTDGQGSTGVAMVEPPPSEPHAVQPLPARTTFSCQFDDGPRAGQIQSYAGVTGMEPMQVGIRCTDGQGSNGVAVPDAPMPASAPERPPAMPPAASLPPAPTREAEPPPPPEALPPVAASMPIHSGSVPGAAVGATVRGLPGAKWADPNNSGSVTGYIYNGRYHRGEPPGYEPITATVVSQSAGGAGPVRPVENIPPDAIVGSAVRGEAGAVWADLNNDGVADGYVEDGRYFPGVPPGFTGGAVSRTVPPPPAAPSPFSPPPVIRSGQRG